MPEPTTPNHGHHEHHEHHEQMTDTTSLKVQLTDKDRRLARYLYLDDLVRGRRATVLEVGCRDGQTSVFLSERGVPRVLGIDKDAAAIALGQARGLPPGVELRHVSRLTHATLADESFDVILVSDDGTLLFEDEALFELRRVLRPGGSLVWAARSKEASSEASGTIGYFDLLDRLEKVGRFGPPAMLGQSAFVATTLVPFGAESPDLVMDDTLCPAEAPEEYIAVCGGPKGVKRPFQVLQLPKTALEAQGGPLAAPPPAPPPERPAEIGKETLELVARLQGELAQKESERSALHTQVETLTLASQAIRAKEQELAERISTQAGTVAQLQQRLKEQAEAQKADRAQLTEMLQHQRLWEQSSQELQEAALLHEKEHQALKALVEEREAYIVELEGQLKDLSLLHERLAETHRDKEGAIQSEREARKRLAEVTGQLLRVESELAEARQTATQSSTQTWAQEEEAAAETFAQVQRERKDLQELERTLAEERQALTEAQRAIAQDRQALSRGASELSQLREQLEEEQRRLKEAEAGLILKAQDLERDTQAFLQERERLLAVQPEGAPVPVGDLPTQPHVSLTATQPLSPQEEIARLQARVTELEEDNAKLKEKASEAERETWKYMKARSDAEAQAAEVREDTVRKLRDARKLASVELTRAMEEATKKAVALREELTRTERERKEAVAQIKELKQDNETIQREVGSLKQELEALRWSSSLVPPQVQSETSESAQQEVVRAREEGAAAVLALRTEAERAIAEERVARRSAEDAERRASQRLAELRENVLQLELSLGEARDAQEGDRRRAEMLQEEIRRLSDEASTRQRAADQELSRAQHDLMARERTLADIRLEREALGRLLSEVEREAYSRAERARELRTRLLEREREIEALRIELSDRDRKITALEQQIPPAEEIARLEADLEQARGRLSELEAERARQDSASDEAVATALRERARASRLSESLGQTARERDEALSRCVELEGRISTGLEERTRLRSEMSRLEEAQRQGQTELASLGERLKQTRRELEAEERRASKEAERALEAGELRKRLDEASKDLSDLRIRTLELQTELTKARAQLAQPTQQAEVVPAAPLAPVVEADAPENQPQDVAEPPEPTPTQEAAPPPSVASPKTPSNPPQAAKAEPGKIQPPVLEHHMVRRVLALGQALGLEPVHVPLQVEPSKDDKSEN